MSSSFRHPSLYSVKTFFIVTILSIVRFFGLGSKFLSLLLQYKFNQIPSIFKSYIPDKNDVFVATFPKSGTNWMMQIIIQLSFLGEAPEFEHVHDIVPWAESSFDGVAPLKNLACNNKNNNKDDDVMDKASSYFASSPNGFRPIKTSSDPKYIPYNDSAKYVTVIRDPKEVFVSSFFFLPGTLGIQDQVSKDAFLNIVTEKDVYGKKFAKHIAHAWDRRDLPNWHIVIYNNLKQNPKEEIQKLAKFLGVDLTAEQLEKVLYKISFPYMKENDFRYGPPLLPLLHDRQNNDKTSTKTTSMMRSGKSGNSKELFSQEERNQIDEMMQSYLKELKSDFPYNQYFGNNLAD